jgi:hypothetical protein
MARTFRRCAGLFALALSLSSAPSSLFAQEDSRSRLSQRNPELIARNEADFERIEEMCEEGCYTELGIVEAARERGAPVSIEGTFMIDIYRVQNKPYAFSLHSIDRYDPTCVIIDIDKKVMAQLLDRYDWEEQLEAATDEEIVVARRKKLKKATMDGANRHFAGRRILVRGTTSLIKWPWPGRGAARDKQVVITITSADDVVRVPVLSRD